MRISTSQIYDQSIRSIMENQEGLAKTQEQLATGKRILTPADDPVGAAKVLRLTEELDGLTQFQRNNDLVTGSLEQQEAVLTNITNSINRARTLVVQAGSGILDDPDKRAIGAELEQIKLEIFDLMNTQDADGNYMYAGYQSANQAFTYNPASSGNAITFSGDAGVSFIQLSSSSKIQSTSNGYEVFENVLSRFDFSVTGTTAADLQNTIVKEQGTFDTFFNKNYDPVTSANNDYQVEFLASGEAQLTNTGTGAVVGTVGYTSGSPFTIKGMQFEASAAVGDTINFSLDAPEKKSMAQSLHEIQTILMDSTIDDSALQEAIADSLVGLDNGLEKISLERASIGSRLNIAESTYESNLDMEIAAKASRSSIQDVDYAEASTEFAKQETALNAALATFPQVSNLSLFNFI
ncbi:MULTISPECIES: flagellar hook-associated protein FlgL [Alteromonas]|uniref:Flagellar biosynthesis protein FlgL n=1 Tax=Alteromonas stellipolaris TaxID=233316 RepID=A0AAW7Z789_9ALTE|nr:MULTISPECIES: flagellar hook-associated protein FlgL [Alteromonas]AMJ90767.1 flagellar biosynthesis protein FlgL [Alteromonas sp. Mac2]ALM91501.1 Flagellar hook-associated protein FlgL [Alteromonas stellipolaris LMG 21856]AMJ74473.1 flagellar biosynthesis protein FlgL [Alteromonas stellipolaris]AMJ86908.1 flagellar biosynthesis protein FlgL [Alteromonas sp. Mac1]AMJ94650.1 flagellar biosynthesis protein FlgL [Alteromonas stellipolaris]